MKEAAVFAGQPLTRLLFCRLLAEDKTCSESEPELEPHDELCTGSNSPGPEPVSPYSSRCEDRVRDRPSTEKKDESIFSIRNLEKDKAERLRKESTEPLSKEPEAGGISASKDTFSPLMVQTESPSHFSPGHLQSLALSGLHSQQFFNPLSTGSPLLFHPSQFAMAPGAFSAMGMSHLLASVSGASGLENGGLTGQGSGGTPSPFPFHLSQHMLASQVRADFTFLPSMGAFSHGVKYFFTSERGKKTKVLVLDFSFQNALKMTFTFF